MKSKKDAQQFFHLVFVSVKNQNITVSAAILCPAVCVSDTMKKAKLERVAKASNTSQADLSLLFIGKEQTEKLYQEKHKSKAKKGFFCINVDGATQTMPADENIQTFSVFRPTCIPDLVPL